MKSLNVLSAMILLVGCSMKCEFHSLKKQNISGGLDLFKQFHVVQPKQVRRKI